MCIYFFALLQRVKKAILLSFGVGKSVKQSALTDEDRLAIKGGNYVEILHVGPVSYGYEISMTLWVIPSFSKPKGETCTSVTISVDLTKLNANVHRERHILPSVDHTLAQLTGATIFTMLDANSGFWQIKLSEESSLYTTFITPFKRYRFNLN